MNYSKFSRNLPLVILSISLLITIMIISSCQDESLNTQNITDPLRNDPPFGIWTNPLNPFDSVGNYINECYDYVISFKNAEEDSLEFYNSVLEHTGDYCCSFNWFLGAGSCTDYMATLFNDADYLFQNFTLEQIIDSFYVDENAQSEMKDLITIVTSFPDTSNIDLIYTAIKVWENDVVNSNYTLECKKQLLGSSSALRYALHYWNEQRLLESESPWILNLGSILNPKSGGIAGKQIKIAGFWNTLLGIVCVAAATAVGFGLGLGMCAWAGPGAIYGGIGMGAFCGIGMACVYPWIYPRKKDNIQWIR